MSNLIEVVVNGEKRQIAAGQSVRGVLEALEIDGARVAVELNRRIVRRASWDETPVEAGAEIEIVQFVGGGRR